MSNPCDNCGCDLRVCKDCDWYNTEFIPKSVIEDIKEEIRHLHDWAFDREEVLRIIDKYTSGKENNG